MRRSAYLRPLAAAALGVALSGLPVSTASAAPDLHGTPRDDLAGTLTTKVSSLVTGPSLVNGGGALWLEGDADAWRLREYDDFDDRTKTVSRGRLVHTYDDEYGDVRDDTVGASAIVDDLAVLEIRTRSGTTKYRQYQHSSQVRAWSLSTRAWVDLSRCSAHEDAFNGSSPFTSPGASVTTDGTTVAVAQCGKTQFFKPETDGSTPVATLPANVIPAAIAGNYVAARLGGTEPHGYAIIDWTTGAERYRIPTPDPQVQTTGIGLQDDGSAAVIVHTGKEPAGCGGVATWHTAATPTGAVLQTGVCNRTPGANNGKASVVVTAAEEPGRELRLVGLDAESKRIAWLGLAPYQQDAFALDLSGEVNYALAGCGTSWTLVQASGTPPVGPTACAGLRARRASRTGRTLKVSVRLASDATGEIEVTLRAVGKEFVRTLVPSGGGATKTFRLPKWASGRSSKLTIAYAGDGRYRAERIIRRFPR